MKRREKIVAGVLLAAVCAIVTFLRPAAIVQADDTKPAAKVEPWKAEDEIFQEYAVQMRISPDGKWLVWVKSTADKEKDSRVSNHKGPVGCGPLRESGLHRLGGS